MHHAQCSPTWHGEVWAAALLGGRCHSCVGFCRRVPFPSRGRGRAGLHHRRWLCGRDSERAVCFGYRLQAPCACAPLTPSRTAAFEPWAPPSRHVPPLRDPRCPARWAPASAARALSRTPPRLAPPNLIPTFVCLATEGGEPACRSVETLETHGARQRRGPPLPSLLYVCACV
ncbi:MAG: hypothetical protein J3K34DRAFT_437952 [Monoraphidium minutum]|nr:MAG: hypothetical protein J3K34DRAFT_437952 [Monoraphidium minutum]